MATTTGTQRHLNITSSTLDASGNVLSSGNVGIGTSSPSAPLVFGKSVYGGFDSENFYRIKLQDQGGTLNDVGIGQTASGSMGFNITSGGTFIFNNGTSGEIARFNGAGLGIGTTSPRGKLDIVGNTDDDADFLTIQDNDTSAGSHRPSIRFRSDTAQIGQIVSLDNSMRFSVGTTEDSLLEITSSGNVGIGTATPLQPFQVDAGSNIASFRSVGNGQNNKELLIQTGGDRVILDAKNADDGTAASLAFELGNSEKARLTTTGLGIGTTSPAKQLVVRGSAPWIRIEEDSVSNKRLDLWVDPTSAIGYIGANQSAQQLSFQTASSDRIRILNNGNVGIGTTSPSSKLDVYGVVASKMGTSSALSTGVLEITSGATPSQIKITTAISFGGTTNAHSVTIRGFQYGGASTVDLQISWHVYNNSFYNRAITSSGSWAPTVTLAVENGYVVIHLLAPGYWPKMYVESLYNAYGGTAHSQGWSWTDAAISGDSGKPVQTVPYKTNFGNSFVMSNTGNVGIGTTSPGTKLHVGSGSGATVDTGYQMVIDSAGIAGLQILSATTQSGRIVFGDSGDNDIGMIKYDHTDNSMGFRTNGSGNERMRIDSSGNVGIGTTSPSRKLSVAGAIELAGVDTALSTGNPAIRRGNSGEMFLDAPGNVTVTIDSNNNQTTALFNVRKDASTELFRIQENGNVGIGTTSPSAKLNVVGNGQIVKIASTIASQYAETSHTNDAGDQLVIGSIGSTYSSSDWAGMRYVYATAGDLAIKANASSGNVRIFAGGATLANERMRITSTGAISFGSTGTAYGTSGQLLTSNGNGSPTWQDAPSGGPDTVTVTGSTGSRTTTIVEGLNLAGVENLGMPTTGGYTVMGISNGSGSVAAGTVVSFHDSDTTENDDPFAVDLRSNGDYFWNMHGRLTIEETNQNRGGDLEVENNIGWGGDLSGAGASGQQLVGMSNGDSISGASVHIGASGKVHLHGSSGSYNLEIHQTGAAAIELNAFTGELQVAGAGITPGTDTSPNALGVGADGRLQTVNVGNVNYTPLAVTKNGSNQFPVVFANAENFSLSCAGTWTITPTIASGDIGKTGTIIITNTATTTPGSLPSTFKTPNGDSIVFQTDSGDVSILSYLVVSTSIVLVNYVGNFS